MGVVAHKTIKNAWAAREVYEAIRHRPSVGVIGEDPVHGLTLLARPKGVVVATIPITNPTSTVIFEALLCMKARNAVIFGPHRGARRSVKEAARILGEAAEAAGAPAHAIQCLTRAQTEYAERMMQHRDVGLIVATGTSAVVRHAQASGTPTYGVGPGNVPVYVHRSADLASAAHAIVMSKTFDNGTVCASEQALVAEKDTIERLRPRLEAEGAYFCSEAEAQALEPVCFDRESERMRADAVGQPAAVLAGRAGISVPPSTTLLVAEPGGVGREHPLSYELLMPVLALYPCAGHESALEMCGAVLRHGGEGHTIGVHTTDESVVAEVAELDAARVLVNSPTTHGAIGGFCNGLVPSLTLACGAGARNINAENIFLEHLLDIQRIARYRPNPRWV
jgi:acyl-CoA reductase-like NAD-dependent aldehyde dehydrogenase